MSTLNVNIPTTFEETVTAPQITGLETPTQPTDAANKQYVDDAVSGGSGDYLPLAGGTMSGAINMGENAITNVATPSADTDVSNKQYTDYMKNCFEIGWLSTNPFYHDLRATLIIPKFRNWRAQAPQDFLISSIISGVISFPNGVTSQSTLDITHIFTNNEFYLNGPTEPLSVNRTQDFPLYNNNSATGGNIHFNFNVDKRRGSISITIPPLTQAHSPFLISLHQEGFILVIILNLLHACTIEETWRINV